MSFRLLWDYVISIIFQRKLLKEDKWFDYIANYCKIYKEIMVTETKRDTESNSAYMLILCNSREERDKIYTELREAGLPGLKPAYVFIICAILSFMIVRSGGECLMIWKEVEGKVVWELIYVFAGGFAAGTLINGSGAARSMGNVVAQIGLTGGIVTIFVIIVTTLILSDVTSNTATAAVAISIVISIGQSIGRNPIPYVYVASIGVNLSYMLPTSIRAIPVGYGLQPKYMLKEGWKLTVIVIVLMTIVSYFMLMHWESFSGV